MNEDDRSQERPPEPADSGRGWLQWVVVLTPIAAAFAQQQSTYTLVDPACGARSAGVLHVPAILSLLIVAGNGAAAWAMLGRVGRRAPADERTRDGRARFMTTLALLLSAFAVVLIVAQWMPTWFIDPCQR